MSVTSILMVQFVTGQAMLYALAVLLSQNVAKTLTATNAQMATAILTLLAPTPPTAIVPLTLTVHTLMESAIFPCLTHQTTVPIVTRASVLEVVQTWVTTATTAPAPIRPAMVTMSVNPRCVVITRTVLAMTKCATPTMTTASSVVVDVVLMMAAVKDATMTHSIASTPNLSVTWVLTLVVVRLTLTAMLGTSATRAPTPVSPFLTNVQQMLIAMRA